MPKYEGIDMLMEIAHVSKTRYEELITTEAHMNELEARGVDNWQDYVGRLDHCSKCDTDLDWGHEECPVCGAELSEEEE